MPSFAGYTLPDELRMLAEQIRRFVQEEIIPAEQRVDPDAEDLADDDHKRLSDMTKAAGLWALGAREEHGGGGLDTFGMCVALEEMS
ncbi:MAG TPA: acyl-CoA dehydrogenase family protein, partial [Methylomirabilota bacterium]